MSVEHDLRSILASMTIARRPATYVYVSAPSGSLLGAAATIEEEEGTTFVVDRVVAEQAGLAWSFPAAWLTIDVRTALDGIGLTAALATALTKVGIPCNVLAGFHNDHLLVPLDRADGAIAILQNLRSEAGDLSERKQVLRAGATVRRPAALWTTAVDALLRHLESAGFTGSPRLVGTGVDAEGRHTVEFIEGDVNPARVWSDEGVYELGQLLRRLHDATASFQPRADSRWQESFLRSTGPDAVFSHGDAAPWNIVARGEHPVALIDWELAGPVEPLSEVAHTAWLNARLFDDFVAELEGTPPAATRVHQLRSFVDGYGLSPVDRAKLATRIIDVAVLSCAGDAIEAIITPGHTDEGRLVWGVAWRARSAAWLVRHRDLHERALR